MTDFDYQWEFLLGTESLNNEEDKFQCTKKRVKEFLKLTGIKPWYKKDSFIKGKKCLDAGCGPGRFTCAMKLLGASKVDSFDISEQAIKRCKKINPDAYVFDIWDLKPNPVYDFVLSWGVLHHTKNTETSFKYLTKFLSKGGHISIYVYNKKAPVREYVDDYIRKTTVNMSVNECLEFSKDMAILGKSLSKLNKKIKIPREIKILGVKAGTYDVQRFIYWHFLKCFWDSNDNFERSVGVNFDWYYPKFAYRHTSSEVKNWYKHSRIKLTHFKEIESGISATGLKH